MSIKENLIIIMDTVIVNKLVVIGVGLIGGSFAASVKRAQVCEEIIGIEANESLQSAAQQLDYIDRVAASISDISHELCADDLVFIAVPTLSVPSVLKQCANCLPAEVTITDGASVKGSILTAAEKIYGEIPQQLVLGHPIAGSEQSGINAGRNNLFENHRVVLTPSEHTAELHLSKVTRLWEAIGAKISIMDVVAHDQVLAATSHLPHALAFSLVDTLAHDPDHEDIFTYAAGGFRDFTRIASSNPTMWHDIMCANKDAVVRSLDLFSENLKFLRNAIQANDGDTILDLFTRAKYARDDFLKLQTASQNTKEQIPSMSSNLINYVLSPGGTVNGTIRVPGDKSISHRSIMLGSLAEGITEVTGFLEGEDALATLQAFRDMGVNIEGPVDGKVTIHGVGLNGLQKPEKPLDMGNSGTAMRLMSGLLAGQNFDATLVGDVSLSKRPMGRIAKPLAEMGVTIETEEGGRPPLKILGSTQPQALDYEMPMASAQVKSCVLLAGLYAEGTTSVVEPAPTRDHTERMLRGFGYDVKTEGSKVTLQGGGKLTATNIDVPSDISSSAFFMVAAAITPNSDLTIKHVGMNPTRVGIINILREMGANIQLGNEAEVGGEPVADVRIQYSPLKGIHIPEDQVPLAIDEFPVLFVAAAAAEGTTVLTGAEELRVKESDRIQVMADGLNAIGADATPTPDGMVINGGTPLKGGDIQTHHDHRIAMSFAVASLIATEEIRIHDCATVATSFPGFADLAKLVGISLEVQS
ncbi:bifunctional prephenate dehydrogenase/3-phosphoshikimate 1-carboxyvinyltransferase [Sessilibacter corallicola]|uniref:3-phosphoshikimate 1-carboxyvinyltransferase n=1 Tax=Sessilibacter corallicola TaxID=2904075 RepID=A0ABQ0AA32_9GAMM